MQILAELTPLDPSPGTRPTIRVASGQDRAITGLNGVPWWPAMLKKPSLSIRLFDGDFSNTIDPGQASLDLHAPALEKMDANIRRYIWAGAGVTLYAGDSGQAWPWSVVFKGKVDSFRTVGNTTSLAANVDTEPFEANALYLTYAGTGGIEGGADLKGKPKPWTLGNPQNIEPILINNIDSIFQVSAYGAIKAVTTLYERGSAFGASYGDYANYTALQAATIPAGRWATCLASGLIRLSAPPYGVITADVQGDYLGTTWRRLPGAIIQRVCSGASISSTKIDSASFTALDAVMAALPSGGNISLYQTEQISVIDLAQMIALSCNAQAGVSLTGLLFATRISMASPVATLDAQGGAKPGVITSTEVDVSPPYKRMQMGGNRAWRVHTFDEIAFGAELIDRGTYDAATVYRDGNIVTLDDGSRWLFIATTPVAGSMPTDVNANWSRMTDAQEARLGTNVIANSHFRNGLSQWRKAYSGTNGLGTVTLDASGALSLANPSPAAGGAVFGSFSAADNQGLFSGSHLFRVTAGQRVAWRLAGTVSRSGAQITPYFRLLAKVPGSDLAGSAGGTLFSGFSHLDSAHGESAGYFDIPATAGVYWLNVEYYGVCNSGTSAVNALISGTELAFIDPAQTTPPVWAEGPTAEYSSTYGADWSTNLTSIPYDDILNNDDSTTLGFNGSFESWTGSYPDGWSGWSGAAPTKETSIVRYGTNAVKITAAGSDIGMQAAATWVNAPMPAGTIVAGNVDFYLQARTSGLPGLFIRLFTNAALTTSRDITVQPSLTTTGVWQTVPWIARVNPGEKIYGIIIYTMGSWTGFPNAFTGTAIFDRLNFAFFNGGLDNQQITIAANGALSGAGGGSVTITGLGYAGDLNATYGTPSTAPVGTITGGDVASTINSGGGVATNQVSTDAIINNAVTQIYDAVSGAAQAGTGNYVTLQTLMSLNVTVTAPADLYISSFLNIISTTGVLKAWAFALQLNGTTVLGGSGTVYSTGGAPAKKVSVAAGTHTITMKWNGDDASVQAPAGGSALTVDRRYK